MVSFRYLCEALDKVQPGQDLWGHDKKTPELDEQAMAVILRGLEVRPDRTDGKTFWDDFITVIGNNSEGASRLFGISSDIISGWAGKIKIAMKRVREENAADDDKAHMTQTGDTNLD